MGKVKTKKIGKIVGKSVLTVICLFILFLISLAVANKILQSKELKLLEDAGYVNPVSVGDYSLNVYSYGKDNGNHTLVCLSGMGTHNYSVTLRHVTDKLSDENKIVFVDRAGYGLSDDTKIPQTTQRVVEDYRTALKNAGYEAPFVLLPHSLGGAYATYWENTYPNEIEGIVFLDGSQLGLNKENYWDSENPILSKIEVLLCKMGAIRVVKDFYYNPLFSSYTEEDQAISDALLFCSNGWNNALASEDELCVEGCINTIKAVKANDVPKVYICASWGLQTKEEIIEMTSWVDKEAELKHYKAPVFPMDECDKFLEAYNDLRENDLKPYLDKMGNCELILLPGIHGIYEQRPDDVVKIINDFLEKIDN